MTAATPRLVRSMLFVPASRPDMMPKAAASAADAVCLDLEDAVVPAEKAAARAHAVHALRTLDFGARTRILRINAADTPYAYRDLVEVIEGAGDRVDLVMLPKAGDARDVVFVDMLLSQIEGHTGLGRAIGIEAQIESAQGYVNLREIAAASPRLDALIFGPGDYAASMRMPSSGIGELDAHDELYPGHRWHAAMHGIVAAARANGLRCLDGPYSAYKDAAGFARACRIARAMGFDGKQCIHPGQLETANALFSPSEAEIAAAAALVQAFEAAVAAGHGAGTHDGRMIDAASLRMARTILDRAGDRARAAPRVQRVNPAPVVRVSGIRKAYGRVVAVDGVSFDVRPGEIFGLVGPNGAGKTTTMECLEGLRAPDGGSISVLGLDPFREAAALKIRIGVQLQEAQLQKRITVREAIDFWASLYPSPVDPGLLLDQLGLRDKRNAWFMTLSGGQKQRLFIALALINDPEVVFLDELTTGLDPQARRAIWELVRGIRARGKTVVLTTHLMEEAERLCDRVAIIEHGRVIDVDTPAGLVARHCPDRAVILATVDPTAPDRFRALPGVEAVDAAQGSITIRGTGAGLVADVIQCVSAHQIAVTDFRTVMPTLEDVFLRLTGHSIRD